MLILKHCCLTITWQPGTACSRNLAQRRSCRIWDPRRCSRGHGASAQHWSPCPYRRSSGRGAWAWRTCCSWCCYGPTDVVHVLIFILVLIIIPDLQNYLVQNSHTYWAGIIGWGWCHSLRQGPPRLTLDILCPWHSKFWARSDHDLCVRIYFNRLLLSPHTLRTLTRLQARYNTMSHVMNRP